MKHVLSIKSLGRESLGIKSAATPKPFFTPLLALVLASACQLLSVPLLALPGSQHSLAVQQGLEEEPEERGPAIQVVASIKPLTLITRDLLGPGAKVETLVPSGASPHDYSLKVSDVQRLRRADLVVWMGPELERFLEKPLAGLAPERVLALGNTTAEPHAQPQAGSHARSHAEAEAEADPQAHDKDLHQWLDPSQAEHMARAIARHLQTLFPGRADTIQERLDKQLAAYDTLDRELERVLTPVKNIGFVVQHRGYDYFVRAYQLNQLGWISLTPEQPPGVRHLYELEKRLRAGPGGQCLFVERSHVSTTARNLAAQLQLRLQPLDILGESASSYPDLMRNLADEVVTCLNQGQ